MRVSSPHRRWNVSLCAAMCILALVGLLLSRVDERVRRQQVAILAIHESGGVFEYSISKADSAMDAGLSLLERVVGRDVLFTVNHVTLERDTLDENLLSKVAALEQLESLRIEGGNATTEDELSKIAALEDLDTPLHEKEGEGEDKIGGIRQSSALSHQILEFCRRSNLRVLEVHSEDVATAFIPHLHEMKSLESLSIYGYAISDDDMNRIAMISNLHRLAVQGSMLSDRGALQLRALRRLTFLWITHAHGITDDAWGAVHRDLPKLVRPIIRSQL